MTLRVDVLTVFPGLITGYASEALLARASERGTITIRAIDIRDGTTDQHRSVDDTPFGGGAGMVMRPEPIVRTVENTSDLARPLFVLSPSGRPFSQSVARELASLDTFSLLCGRYEGIDQRAIDLVCDDAISLGDFVLAGGELAALCVIEAVTRLRPGSLGNSASLDEESFEGDLLEYPHFTQPASFRGSEVPHILRSGDHGRIGRWRRAQSLRRTVQQRPDLIARRGGLSDADELLLSEFPDDPHASNG